MGIQQVATTITGNAGTATRLFSDVGTAPATSCRGFLNFSASAGIVIKSSSNITAVTEVFAGRYELTVTTVPVSGFIICNITSDGMITRNVSTSGNIVTIDIAYKNIGVSDAPTYFSPGIVSVSLFW